MFKKAPRILYFIAGSMPSPEQYRDAMRFGPGVAFRNALFVPEVGALEASDGVTGEVPARYSEAYPSGEDAVTTYQDEIRSLVAGSDEPELDLSGKGAGDGATGQQPPAPAQQPAAPAAPVAPAPASAKPAKAADWKPNT